jgi:RHS repeat-associated protein
MVRNGISWVKAGRETVTFSADAAGWDYSANNELIGYKPNTVPENAPGVSFLYDANGNTIQKDDSGIVTHYAYGSKDRLERVTLPDSRIADYAYDPFGRRISKTVDGVKTYFMYADEGLVAEMNSSGTVAKTYGWKPNSTWGTDPVFMTVGSDTYFYHNDHLGTPQKMTDAGGAVVWSAKYRAFGEAVIDPASTIENNLRFAGQYFDVETGKHYNYHRTYDPETGRYTTADPIGMRGGVNFYGFIGNNVVNSADPYGLMTWNGDSYTIGASEIIGAIVMYFDLKSEWYNESNPDCKKGWMRQVEIQVLAVGPALGVGIIASGTKSPSTFDDFDNSPIPNPANFNGDFEYEGIGAALISIGGSYSQIKLGNAYSIGASPAIGVDAGAIGTKFLGSSNVIKVTNNIKWQN